MTFEYEHVSSFDVEGKSAPRDLAGYEGFDERVRAVAKSPDHSIDEEQADLFDINADGLPDLLVTAPALFGGKHGIFVNGAGGNPDSFGPGTVDINPVLGANAATITLKNPNVALLDLDGDGIIDLLHMPAVGKYSVYTPKPLGNAWTWEGRAVTTASGQSSKSISGVTRSISR